MNQNPYRNTQIPNQTPRKTEPKPNSKFKRKAKERVGCARLTNLRHGLLVVLAGGEDRVLGAKDVVERSSLGDAEQLEGVLHRHLERRRVVGPRRGRGGLQPAPVAQDSPPPRPPPILRALPGLDPSSPSGAVRRAPRRTIEEAAGGSDRERGRCHFIHLFLSLRVKFLWPFFWFFQISTAEVHFNPYRLKDSGNVR